MVQQPESFTIINGISRISCQDKRKLLTIIMLKTVLSSKKKAPKLNRINTEINLNKHNTIIRQFILGLSPHPGAWTTVFYKNKTFNFKIFNAQLSKKKFSPKKIVIDNGKLYIGTINYSIELTEVQMEGKKRMPARLFLKGYQNFESYTII